MKQATKISKKDEALKQELKEINQQMNALKARKREIRNELNEKPVKWGPETPLYKLVRPVYLDAFKEMMAEWQKQSAERIDIRNAYQFEFDLTYKHKLIRALNKAMVNNTNPAFFKISQRQLCKYLATHSNLGSEDCIKKALQRCKKCGDKKVLETPHT